MPDSSTPSTIPLAVRTCSGGNPGAGSASATAAGRPASTRSRSRYLIAEAAGSRSPRAPAHPGLRRRPPDARRSAGACADPRIGGCGWRCRRRRPPVWVPPQKNGQCHWPSAPDSPRSSSGLADALARTGVYGLVEQRLLPAIELTVPPLPGRGLRDARDLDRGDLVLGTIGGPVGILGGDHIGAGLGKVERRVHHAGLDPIGDLRPQHRLPSAALHPDPVALLDTAFLGIMRMEFEPVLVVPHDI